VKSRYSRHLLHVAEIRRLSVVAPVSMPGQGHRSTTCVSWRVVGVHRPGSESRSTNANLRLRVRSPRRAAASVRGSSGPRASPDSRSRLDASVSADVRETPAADDDQEHRVRLLLLGKGAVFAHRLERSLAAPLDESE
jgi:hypothetical protein